MEEYRLIINTRRMPPPLSQNSPRNPHSCNGEILWNNLHTICTIMSFKPIMVRTDAGSQDLFDITTALVNIHGRDKKQQEIVDLNSRLKAMLSIAKKQ